MDINFRCRPAGLPV